MIQRYENHFFGYSHAVTSVNCSRIEVTSCCYWIEESSQGYGSYEEPTVLFDEDRFFHLKHVRASMSAKNLCKKSVGSDLALNLDDFDMIVESFLRVQSLSTYISSRNKTEMLYY